MIELYELRQFAAFADAGTLSEAAQLLHLSQPALSRNMKKLEDDLGVPLFLRGKNKLTLNENGKYVLELTRRLLSDADALAEKARDFDRRSRTIVLGICAPAPVWFLAPLLSNLFPQLSLQTELDSDTRLLAGLDRHDYQLIVTHHRPKGKGYFCMECGRESLMFALPKGHRYAHRKRLSFAEMNGENMLLMPDIGFWDFVHTDMMPDSRFLRQRDSYSFYQLVQSSSLPCFTSDLSERYAPQKTGRILVPISDAEATVCYYLICKPEKKKEYAPLFATLKERDL